MAAYAKIDRRILNDEKFFSLSALAKLVFLTIIIHPNMTLVGALKITPDALADELGMPVDTVKSKVSEILSLGLAKANVRPFMIYLPGYLKYNKPASNNVVLAWQHAFDLLPECPLKLEVITRSKAFLEAECRSFCKSFPKDYEILTEGLENPYVSSNSNSSSNSNNNPLPPKRGSAKADVDFVFNYWKEIMCHPEAIMDTKRRRSIEQSLKLGYSKEDLCKAIDGCFKSPYHRGHNETRTVHDKIDLIFRNADKIDGFIAQASPKRLRSSLPPKEKVNIDLNAQLREAKSDYAGLKRLYGENPSEMQACDLVKRMDKIKAIEEKLNNS